MELPKCVHAKRVGLGESEYDSQGMLATGGTPAKFNQRIRAEYERWTKIVTERGIKVQ